MVLWFAIRGSIGNFVTGAAADQTDGDRERRNREKASERVGLVKSMIVIVSYWTCEYAGSMNGCWSSANECMRKSKVMTGWSKRIQLMCVDEKKRGKVTSRGGNGAGTTALAFFCKLDDIGRDRLPNVRGEVLSIFRRAEKEHGRWQELVG